MSQNRILLALSFVAILLLTLFYSNHFDNGFYFDDSHTITDNVYIRKISNIPLFFTNPETASVLPGNRSYRPLVVTMNAFDYWVAGNKYDSHYFHYNIYITYLLQLVLMFFFFRNIFNISFPHRWNNYIALAGTAYYGFHTANAETINYIICRSDSLSTFFIVATFVAFQTPQLRRWHLYLLPLALGLFTKQPVAMVPPLLLVYVFFFEEKGTWNDAFGDRNWTAWLATLRKTAPAWITTIALFAFNIYMTPMNPVNNTVGKVNYLVSQFPVLVHYITNFFFPFSLSADPDFKIVESLSDPTAMGALMVVLFTLGIALYYFKDLKYRPISYGILWFYIALAPTSTLAPRFQVANDHRTFFPYIGLVLAVVCWVSVWIINNEKRILRTPQLRTGIPLLVCLLISLYGYGAYVRNDVWDNSEKLWYDVTQKSPTNGRGLMNYGLTQMNKKKYDTTFYYFNKALEYNPNYPQLHINLAELKKQKGGYSDEEIEQHYKTALRYGKVIPASYYAYGNWLYKKGRIDEAKKIIARGHEMSPAHVKMKRLLDKLNGEGAEAQQKRIDELNDKIKAEPNNLDYIIDLSNNYYKIGNYDESITAANNALKVKPNSTRAYNQLCIAYNKKEDWDKGIAAAQKALEIEPKFQKARNNLKWAVKGKAKSLNKDPQALADEMGIKIKFTAPKK